MFGIGNCNIYDDINIFFFLESLGLVMFSLKKILVLVIVLGVGFLFFIRMLVGKFIIGMENYKLKYEINDVVDI